MVDLRVVVRNAKQSTSGFGLANELINRHANNQSGFIVTEDYQVIQAGIFHIATLVYFNRERERIPVLCERTSAASVSGKSAD